MIIEKNEDVKLFGDKKANAWLRAILSSGNATIEFVKKDGSHRKMICTLDESIIPEDKKPKGTVRKANNEVLAVFDLENQEWRSFRYESVVHFECVTQ